MAIIPVTPVDLEKLVSEETSIIVDLTLAPTLAVVDGVQVFDGSFFLASWTGSLLNLTGGGKRLVLTPPTNFALEQVVTVTVTETGGATLTYRFQVGVEKVTDTDDNSRPSLTLSSGTDYYLGYIKDPGTLYVRFTNPLSPEVPLISATIVDVGYDPVLNKIVVLFVNNGNVYVTTANPGDGPNSIIPPGEAATPTKAVGLPYNSLTVGATASGGLRGVLSTFPRAEAPVVVSLNPRVVRIARPTSSPESLYCVGFIPYKSSEKYASGRFLPFVPLPAGASYAEFTDPAPTPFATYSAVFVYEQGQSTKLVYSPRGNEGPLPIGDAGGADIHLLKASGAGIRSLVTKQDFLPLKEAVPTENTLVIAYSGFGIRVQLEKEDFLPIKFSVPVDTVNVAAVLGTGIRSSFGR